MFEKMKSLFWLLHDKIGNHLRHLSLLFFDSTHDPSDNPVVRRFLVMYNQTLNPYQGVESVKLPTVLPVGMTSLANHDYLHGDSSDQVVNWQHDILLDDNDDIEDLVAIGESLADLNEDERAKLCGWYTTDGTYLWIEKVKLTAEEKAENLKQVQERIRHMPCGADDAFVENTEMYPTKIRHTFITDRYLNWPKGPWIEGYPSDDQIDKYAVHWKSPLDLDDDGFAYER